MSETKAIEWRDEWKVWQIPHDGDGGWRLKQVEILGVRKITAAEAAECYAKGRMALEADDWPDDGDYMYVGVEVNESEAIAFKCVKRITVRLDTEQATEILPAALVDGPKPSWHKS